MALRTGHGKGAGKPRIEVLPADELPAGIPAPPRTAAPGKPAPVRRTPDGRFADREAAKEAGRRGALAAAAKRRRDAAVPGLAKGLGIRNVTAQDFGAYVEDADIFAEHECTRLAQVVGGGICGTAPATMVASAALQIAGSRWAFAQGDVVTGSRLANDSRQNLLAAHELCAKEATARAARGDHGSAAPWLIHEESATEETQP